MERVRSSALELVAILSNLLVCFTGFFVSLSSLIIGLAGLFVCLSSLFIGFAGVFIGLTGVFIGLTGFVVYFSVVLFVRRTRNFYGRERRAGFELCGGREGNCR